MSARKVRRFVAVAATLPRMRPGVVVLAACGLVLPVAPATGLAQVRLDWARSPGAETCSDGAAIASRLREQLGRELFAEPAGLRLEVSIGRDGDAWIASIHAHEQSGEVVAPRTLRSDESCAELERAALLVLALLAGELFESPAEPIEPPAGTATDAPPDPAPVVASPGPEAPASGGVHGHLALEAPIVIGELPGVAPGIGLAAAAGADAWRVELRARHFPDAGLDDNGAHVHFSWTLLAAGVGLRAELLPGWTIGGAAGLELGARVVAVSGMLALDTSIQPTLAPYAGLSAEWTIDRLVVEVGARGAASLLVTRYAAAGTDRVLFAAEPVSLVLWVGLGLALGPPP